MCEYFYLDLGCSNDMSEPIEWLKKFDPRKRINVRLENNNYLVTKGIFDIITWRKDGKNALVENVLYIPSILCNLMTIKKLD